jgi:hypothetical protein
MERIGAEESSTKNDLSPLMMDDDLPHDLPSLLRITWTSDSDGKTMSMRYEDSNGTRIHDSTLQSAGVLQLQKSVNAIEDSVRIF